MYWIIYNTKRIGRVYLKRFYNRQYAINYIDLFPQRFPKTNCVLQVLYCGDVVYQREY